MSIAFFILLGLSVSGYNINPTILWVYGGFVVFKIVATSIAKVITEHAKQNKYFEMGDFSKVR